MTTAQAARRLTTHANRELEEERVSRRTAELRDAEAAHRSILEQASDAFISMDQDGLVREWNSAAQQTFGWRREEAIGQSMASLVIPEGERGTVWHAAPGSVPVEFQPS